MTERYSQLWDSIASTTHDPKAVLALNEILSDEEGRDFVLSLGHEETKLCINVLGRVSFDPHLSLAPP